MPKYAKNCKNRLTDTETDKHIKARDLKILVLNNLTVVYFLTPGRE